MKFVPSFTRARLVLAGVAASSLAVVASAHAALDAAVTAAVTSAGTDLTALYAALTAVGAGLFVARVIYQRFAIR